MTSALGAYQYLLFQQQTQTANNWLTVNVTSQNQTGWPVLYYEQTFPLAFDVAMPEARYRVRGLGRSPAIIHAGRRAVRRSIDLYLRLRPEEELKRFIAGREVIIQGARFRYSLRKTYSIMEQTMNPMGAHVPYRLNMLDPNSAEPRPLASGCVYLERTPVLDQVLAFIMHVTDPDAERDLIRKTNWSPRLPPHMLAWLARPQELRDAA